MPYHAQNNVPVATVFQSPAVYKWPIPDQLPTKLDVFVNGKDVIVQATEDPNGAFVDDTTQEMLLRAGFNSRTFVTAFTGWRFRVWDLSTIQATQTTVDFVAYG